jgi:hypothetical protein
MANKSVYQNYDQHVLDYFGITHPTYVGLRLAQGDTIKVLTTDEYDVVNTNVLSALSTSNLDSTSFKSKKKGFLLPGSTTTIPRVKYALKEQGIVLTNDYEEADFIITHDKVKQRFLQLEVINSTALIADCSLKQVIINTNTHHSNVQLWIDENNLPVILDDRIRKEILHNRYFQMENKKMYNTMLLTGMALNIAMMVQNGTLDVVDLLTVIESSNNIQPITIETIRDIERLVNSSSDDDIALAAMILPTIDTYSKKHLLWTLYNLIKNKLYKFNRIKDVQDWLKRFDYYQYNKIAGRFIQHLHENEELDKESFLYLEEFARKDINIDNREIYKFKVEIHPDYEQYL